MKEVIDLKRLNKKLNVEIAKNNLPFDVCIKLMNECVSEIGTQEFDDEILERIFDYRFGRGECPLCGLVSRPKRAKGRRAFQCSRCSHQFYPLSSTILQKSTKPLSVYFSLMRDYEETGFMSIPKILRMFPMEIKSAGRINWLLNQLKDYNPSMINLNPQTNRPKYYKTKTVNQ